MATSLRSTDILFNDNSIQPSAARVGIDNITTSTDVTLTNTSKFVQRITPTIAGLSVILPNTTTLVPNQDFFNIVNTGYYSIDVKTSNGIRLFTLAPLNSSILNLNSNATANSDWGYGIYLSDTEISSLQGYVVGFAALTSTLFILTYVTAAGATLSVAVTYSGGVATWGTPIQHGASGATVATFPTQYSTTLRLTDTTFIVTYSTSTTNFIRVCSVSGTTITGGTAVGCNPPAANSYMSLLYQLNATTLILTYWNDVDYIVTSYFRVISVSGTTVTVGSATNLGTPGNMSSIFDIIPLGTTGSAFVVMWYQNGSVYRSYSISGTTPTLVSSGTLTTYGGYGGLLKHTTGMTSKGVVKFNYTGATITSVSYYSPVLSVAIPANNINFLKEDTSGKFFGLLTNGTLYYGDFGFNPDFVNAKYLLNLPSGISFSPVESALVNAYCDNANRLVVGSMSGTVSTSAYVAFTVINTII